MESFWPNAENDPEMSKEHLIVAHLINNIPKIVFSKTLTEVKEHENWKNVKLVKKFDPDISGA